MGAEPAVDVGAGVGAGIPESIPSGGGEPTPAVGEPTPAAEPSGQVPIPGATPAAEPGTVGQPSPLPEPHVPWGKFREIQTFNTQLKGQLQSMQDDWGDKEAEFNSQVQELNQKVQALSQVQEDYQAISQILQQNQDLAQQLWERAQQAGPTMPMRGAPTQPAQPVHAQLEPEQSKQLSEALNLIQQERQQRADEAKQAEMDNVSRQLDDKLTTLLTENNYDKVFLPDARNYILSEARKMSLDLEHVPYVFSNWLKGTEAKIQTRVDAIVRGKQVDAGLPAAPGGTPTPITAAPEVGANDEKTNALMLEMLKQRGFSDAG